MPKISVIVPVYNTEKHLKKCIDSIINQTFKDFEIVIVNDGSTDDSEKIIQEYEKNYPEKIKYYKKENGGLSSARNFGVKKSTGEYLIFVDSDDFIDTKLFENIIKYMNESIDLIKFKTKSLDENYNEVERYKGPVFEKLSGEEAFRRLAFSDKLLEPSWLYAYRKIYYDNNQFSFKEGLYHEDFGLTPIIIISAKTVTSIDFYGYFYVQAPNSITRNEDHEKTVKRANDLIIHYDNMCKRISQMDIGTQTRNDIKQYYTNAIFDAMKKLKNSDYKNYVLEVKKRNLIKNIKIKNIKGILKKIILRFKIN